MSWLKALSELFDLGAGAANRATHQDRLKDDQARELAELHTRYLTPWPEPHAWPEAMQPVPQRLHPGRDCDLLYQGKKSGLTHNMRPRGTTAFGGALLPQIYRWGHRASQRAQLCRDLTTEAITLHHGSPISAQSGPQRRTHDHTAGLVAVDRDEDGVTDAAVDARGRVRFEARQAPTARRLLATVATPGGAVVAASVVAVVAALLLAPRGDA